MALLCPIGPQFFKNDGTVAAGCKLYTRVTGTTTPKTAWQNQAGSVAHAQPINLDSAGYPDTASGLIWLTAGDEYRLRLEESDGTLVWQEDDIYGISDTSLSNLADPSSATSGAGMVGYDYANAYAAGTVGATLRALPLFLRADFGAALDGVTNDAAAVQAAFTAANGTGRKVVADGPSCLINSSISQSNHAHYDVDWGECQVEFAGGTGTYCFDMTQAGRIKHLGGVFTGGSDNHLFKTAGSAAAQATSYPTIPAEAQWSRQLELHPTLVTGFDTVFEFGNFTREVKYSGDMTGNVTAVKITGKVVNADFISGELYSALASSQAVLCRGDSGDATYRYAEGLSFNASIMDMVGTTVDIRDAYTVQIFSKQIKTAASGIAIDVTKGVCPITRNITVMCPLVQGKIRIGNGLASSFLFSFKGIALGFSDTDGTAINIQQYTKGVLINGASFNNPTGTARMFAVGADCTQVKLEGLMPDAGTYTNAPTIDSSSVGGVEAEFAGSWTPGIAFGGSSTGITYNTQSGRYYYRGGLVHGFGEITLTSKGAQTGAATITGLPYACRLVNGTATVGKFSAMNTFFTPVLDITEGTSVINVKTGAAGSEAVFDEGDFSNTTVLNFSFSYPVS